MVFRNMCYYFIGLVALFSGASQAFLPATNGNHHPGPSSPSSSRLYSESNIERIEFKIYPDGRVEERVIGVKGQNCHKITEKINEALGEVIQSEPTEEMYEQEITVDQTLSNTVDSSGTGDSWEGASSW